MSDWRSNLLCLWLFFLFYSQRHKRNIPKYCFSSVILLQAELRCFITTAKILQENLPKRKGIKHHILTDYSRQTTDQITAQKYCANPHPNNTYCEPRCSPFIDQETTDHSSTKMRKDFYYKSWWSAQHTWEVIVCCNLNSLLCTWAYFTQRKKTKLPNDPMPFSFNHFSLLTVSLWAPLLFDSNEHLHPTSLLETFTIKTAADQHQSSKVFSTLQSLLRETRAIC